MDASHVNLNKVYSLVSAAGANQILNVSGDLKTLSLADGSSNLTPEQIEDNRKFHQGLLDSLTGITDDKAVQEEVRSKLGLSDGDKQVEPKSISARDIKSVIDLVMSKVSKRIGEVLARSFPAAVNELILEAVKANPKHDVVKAFLQKEGGTLNNLARLCRLTCQALKDGANSAALAYLDGFAYDVADFKDVHWTNEEYDVGLNHRKEEEKALAEKSKPKEQPSVKNEPQPVREEVKKEIREKTDVTQEKTEEKEVKQQPILEVKPKDPNDSAIVAKLKNALGDLYDKKLGDVSAKLLSFIEAHGEEWVGLFELGGSALVNVSHDLVTNDERYSILARAINKRWLAAGQPVNDENVEAALKDVAQNAVTRYEQVVRFRMALRDNQATIEAKNKEVDERIAGLVKSAKKDLLAEIRALHSLETESGEVYNSMLDALKNTKKDNELEGALKKRLEEILNDGLANLDVVNVRANVPGDGLKLVSQEADIRKEANAKNVKFQQGAGTNLCYLRSIENGLIAGGKANMLPTLQGGFLSKKYTFRVDVGGTKTLPVDLTVTKDEIENVKTWYDANWKRYNAVRAKFPKGNSNVSGQVEYGSQVSDYDGFASYGKQKASFTDLDWAINIAQAKRAMWRKEQSAFGTKAMVAAPSPVGIQDAYLGKTALTGGYRGNAYENYLREHLHLITQMGCDTDVAEFFGLKEDDNFAVNHNFSKEDNLVQNKDNVEPPNDLEVFKRWSKVRQWKKEHDGGILTLNVSNRHFVAVRDFYYDRDDDYGFIVRDSNDQSNTETKINVKEYTYGKRPDDLLLGEENMSNNGDLNDKKSDNEKHDTLHIHCFLPEA